MSSPRTVLTSYPPPPQTSVVYKERQSPQPTFIVLGVQKFQPWMQQSPPPLNFHMTGFGDNPMQTCPPQQQIQPQWFDSESNCTGKYEQLKKWYFSPPSPPPLNQDPLNPRQQPTPRFYQEKQPWNHSSWSSKQTRQGVTHTDKETIYKGHSNTPDQENPLFSCLSSPKPVQSQFNQEEEIKKEEEDQSNLREDDQTEYQAPKLRLHGSTGQKMTFQKPQVIPLSSNIINNLISSRKKSMLMPKPVQHGGTLTVVDVATVAEVDNQKSHQFSHPVTDEEQREEVELRFETGKKNPTCPFNSSPKQDDTVSPKRVSFCSNNSPPSYYDKVECKKLILNLKPRKSILKDGLGTVKEETTISSDLPISDSTESKKKLSFTRKQEKKCKSVKTDEKEQNDINLVSPKKSLRPNRSKSGRFLDGPKKTQKKLSTIQSSRISSTVKNIKHDGGWNGMQIYDCHTGMQIQNPQSFDLMGYAKDSHKTTYTPTKSSEFTIKVRNLRQHNRLPMLNPILAVKLNCTSCGKEKKRRQPISIHGVNINRLGSKIPTRRKRLLKKKKSTEFESRPIMTSNKFKLFQEKLRKLPHNDNT